METKPTSDEYAAACATVKRMQEVVMKKFLLTLKGHEKEETVIIGMPEIGPDVVKFQTLLSPPFIGDGHPLFKSALSPEISFPTEWLNMSNEDIQNALQEEKRIRKEKDLRLNEERLAMVLETGIEIQPERGATKQRVVLYNHCYLIVDDLYQCGEESFNKILQDIKGHVRKMEQEKLEELAQLAELKKKYPDA